MDTDNETKKQSAPRPTPLKEKLWNLLGIIFYLCIAWGAVYHLILGH